MSKAEYVRKVVIFEDIHQWDKVVSCLCLVDAGVEETMQKEQRIYLEDDLGGTVDAIDIGETSQVLFFTRKMVSNEESEVFAPRSYYQQSTYLPIRKRATVMTVVVDKSILSKTGGLPGG